MRRIGYIYTWLFYAGKKVRQRIIIQFHCCFHGSLITWPRDKNNCIWFGDFHFALKQSFFGQWKYMVQCYLYLFG